MKRRLFSALLALCMCLALFPAKAFAVVASRFHPDDIAVINDIINTNGLDLPTAPEDGSTIPDEWHDKSIWDWDSPRRVIILNLKDSGLTGSLDVSGLPKLETLNCSNNQLTELALNETVSYEHLDVRYNYMEDESNVTGWTYAWDDESFFFNPQLRRVTFEPNEGTGTMENGRATDGEAFELPACEFTAPAGKQFKTWAIGSADGTQVDAGDTHTFMADTTVYAIWEDIPEIDSLQIAVFRAGNRTNYTVGETVALAARAENGTTPYRYQFYVIRSNGSKVILRDYAYSNVFNWQPVTPDTYQVGVNVKDAAGEVVNREETVTVDPPQVDPLAVAVFRTGSRLSYKPGDTITLAARAEGGTTPYRYQFYVIRSNGTVVILRDYAYSNVFDWQPVTPDTYQVGVRIRDGAGQVVDQEKAVAVLDPQAAPLAVAVFRAGYREYYEPGETIALAARAEGGAVPYRYRFHVVDSDGTKTILRDYAYSNVFRWTPEVPDIYQVFVSVKDGSGTVVEEQCEIWVGFRK